MSDDKVVPTHPESAPPGGMPAGEVEECQGAPTATVPDKPKKTFRARCKRLKKRVAKFFRRLRPRKKKKFKKFEPESKEDSVEKKEEENHVPVDTHQIQISSGSTERDNMVVAKKQTSRRQNANLKKLEFLQTVHGISVMITESVLLKSQIPQSEMPAPKIESVSPVNGDHSLFWRSSSTILTTVLKTETSSTSLTMIRAESPSASLTMIRAESPSASLNMIRAESPSASLTMIRTESPSASLTMIRSESRIVSDNNDQFPIWCSTPACLMPAETVDNNGNADVHSDNNDEEYKSDEEEELDFSDTESTGTCVYVEDEPLRCKTLPCDLVEDDKQKKQPPLSLATVPPLVRSASAPVPVFHAKKETTYIMKLRMWVNSVENEHWLNIGRFQEEVRNFKTAVMRDLEENVFSYAAKVPRMQVVELQAKRLPEDDEEGIKKEEENKERKEFEQEMKGVELNYAYKEALKAPVPPMPGVRSIQPRGVLYTDGNIDRLVLEPYSPIHPDDADICQPVPMTPTPLEIVAFHPSGSNDETDKEHDSWDLVPVWKPEMDRPMSEEPKGNKSPSEIELERVQTALLSKPPTNAGTPPKVNAMKLDQKVSPIEYFSPVKAPLEVLKPELPEVNCDDPQICQAKFQTSPELDCVKAIEPDPNSGQMEIAEGGETLPCSPEPTLPRATAICESLPDVVQRNRPVMPQPPPATTSVRRKQKVAPIKDSSHMENPLEDLEVMSPTADDNVLDISHQSSQSPTDLHDAEGTELARKSGDLSLGQEDGCETHPFPPKPTLSTRAAIRRAVLDIAWGENPRKPETISGSAVAEDLPPLTEVVDGAATPPTPSPVTSPGTSPEVKASVRLKECVSPIEDSSPRELPPEVFEVTPSKDNHNVLHSGQQIAESPTYLDGGKGIKLARKPGALSMERDGCQTHPFAPESTLPNMAEIRRPQLNIAWAEDPGKPEKLSATAVATNSLSLTPVDNDAGTALPPNPPSGSPPEVKASVRLKKWVSPIEDSSLRELPPEVLEMMPPKDGTVSPTDIDCGMTIEHAQKPGQMELVGGCDALPYSPEPTLPKATAVCTSLTDVTRSNSPYELPSPPATAAARNKPSLTQMFLATGTPLSPNLPPATPPKRKKSSRRRSRKVSPMKDFELEIYMQKSQTDLDCSKSREFATRPETPLTETEDLLLLPKAPPSTPPKGKKASRRRKNKVSPMKDLSQTDLDCSKSREFATRPETPLTETEDLPLPHKPPPGTPPKGKKASRRCKNKVSPMKDLSQTDLEHASRPETPLMEKVEGCKPLPCSPEPMPPEAATSYTPVYDFARSVTPYSQKPTATDIASFASFLESLEVQKKADDTDMDYGKGIHIAPKSVTPYMDIVDGCKDQPSSPEPTLPGAMGNCASFPDISRSDSPYRPQTPPATAAGRTPLSHMPGEQLASYYRVIEPPPWKVERDRIMRSIAEPTRVPYKTVHQIKGELRMRDLEMELARLRLKIVSQKFSGLDSDDPDLSEQTPQEAPPYLNCGTNYAEPTPKYSREELKSRFPELVPSSGQRSLQTPADLNFGKEKDPPQRFGTAVKKKVSYPNKTLPCSPEPMVPGAAASGMSLPHFDQNENPVTGPLHPCGSKEQIHCQKPESFTRLRENSRGKRNHAKMKAEMAAENDEGVTKPTLADTSYYFKYIFGPKAQKPGGSNEPAESLKDSRNLTKQEREAAHAAPDPYPPLKTKAERRKAQPCSERSAASGLSLPMIAQPKKSATNVTDTEARGNSELTMTQLVSQTNNIPGSSSKRTPTTDEHSVTGLPDKGHKTTNTQDRKRPKFTPFLKKIFGRR